MSASPSGHVRPRRAAVFAEDLLCAMSDSELWEYAVSRVESLLMGCVYHSVPDSSVKSVPLPSMLAEPLQHPSRWLAPANNAQPIARIPGLFPELQTLRSNLLAAFSSWMDYQQFLFLTSKLTPSAPSSKFSFLGSWSF